MLCPGGRAPGRKGCSCLKYFAYTFNYVTLHKAIIHGEREWGVENTFILYTNAVTDPPKALLEGRYQSLIVNKDSAPRNGLMKRLPTVSSVLEEKRLVLEFVEYIRQNEPDRKQIICLAVFRDTQLRDTMLIETVKKEYKNAVVMLIEEGLALYAGAPVVPKGWKTGVKKMVYRVMGVPTLSLSNLPHGTNPRTDIIVCGYPQALKGTKRDKGENLRQEIDVFSKENCDHFIRDVLMEEIPDEAYDFVFLTQPLFPMADEGMNRRYEQFLRQLFDLLSAHGTVLIKQHPRDAWDYTPWLSKKVSVCPVKLSKCAYELLSGHFDHPQPITLYSSAACNVKTGKPTIFLYDFFPEIIPPDLFSEKFLRDNGIVRCRSIDELKANLSTKKEPIAACEGAEQ